MAIAYENYTTKESIFQILIHVQVYNFQLSEKENCFSQPYEWKLSGALGLPYLHIMIFILDILAVNRIYKTINR